MKYAIRLAVVAAASASLLAVGAPSGAASATELAVVGRINIAQGLESGAGIAVGGSCAGAEATTGPSADANLCNLGTVGSVGGNCAAWSATVSGWSFVATSATGGTNYRLNLSVTNAGGVLAVTGTATGGGGTKTVVGSGVAVVDTTSGSCGSHAHAWDWAGTLTLAG